MINRRKLIAGAAAAGSVFLPRFAFAEEAGAAAAKTLRIAAVKNGSLSWLLDTIKAEGLDAKAGLKLDIIDVANNQAGPIALLSRDADVIVSDWTWALRQRAMGDAMKFSPYSSALGALMVPKDSPIKTLADLKGKKLGVAGSAIDKSWLLLRAYTKKTVGTDLAELAVPSYGAAPLITEASTGSITSNC